MKVVGLDISSKTGYSCLTDDGQLLDYGTLILDKKLSNFGTYPFNFNDYTEYIAKTIISKVITKHYPDIIVIEETNGSGRANRYSVKMLEFIHKALLHELKDTKFKVVYVSTSHWRKAVGAFLGKEDKQNNAKINKARRDKKSKKELGLKGKITPKHKSVQVVNDKFKLNLLMKDNDAAEAVLLSLAYLYGVKIADGK